jgi:2-oxoglutarate dehydrogenase E1 component
LLLRLAEVPDGFHVHRKLERLLEHRKAMAHGEQPLDWGAAEALAFASLAMDGARIRMSGQDAERGTFSHRHAVLHDQETGEKYMALQHVGPGQAPVEIYNSPLSEAGVLGFEYGFSLANPDGLTLWEAQFGDFHNAAQVIIDQFLSSAEDKWRSLTNLALLLPHGFEGQGPEHSSARIERFFSLTAEDNMQVVIPSTPAQFFHVLRRQVVRPWRKPLIVISPKSLLRHPECVSSIEDCASGRFERMLPDEGGRVDGVSRVLLCSGKVYYDLIADRKERGRDDVAIVRVEQVYPLQPEDMEHVLEPYADGTPLVWVQEEPENMGAWRRMRGKFGERWFGRFPFSGVYRPASASPATGSSSSHKLEQRTLLDEAFA